MKAVMYHYVRDYSKQYPNLRFLDAKNFSRQLDYFENKFGFVSRDDWEATAVAKKTDSLPDGVVLTFDDAMSCHFDFVFRILKERGLWGVFYVPTKPYVSGKMLDVHRVHLLCGRFEGNRLLEVCKNLITEKMLPFENWEKFKSQTYTKQYNEKCVTEFKRILNYFVDERLRSSLVDEISKVLGFNEYHTGFYVDPKSLRKMSAEGMIIGSHTINHPVMSKLDRNTQTDEIEMSFEYLESACFVSHRTYCHPYGGLHSFNNDTISILDNLNVSYSFNVESRDMVENDFISAPQFLPRYDCNDFPFGAAS
jgi:peptidoglycan/xylan/chitin deacetylase (PgdA/CDA1 family)